MSESKFAGIFRNARATPAAAETPPATSSRPKPQTQSQPETPARAARPIGRPPGKRSDPAWKQYSVLLKKETQREAASILRQKDEGLDLSGLVQNLLEGWIERQKT